MARVVVASSNRGKLGEFAALLAGTGIVVVSQGELGISDAEETGLSFVENAILKARNAARHSGLAALADDSGIEVDALDGAPGLYSSRYAGPGASDGDNVGKLLHALADVPAEHRPARFQCLFVYRRHALDPTPLIGRGTWEGRILFTPRGSNGFGYDPVFHVPSHDCASAELPPELKNRISHRGQAMARLLAALRAAPAP